jgi:hypothetical protein
MGPVPRPLPQAVVRWMSRLRWLRALDAALAGLVLWGGVLGLTGVGRARPALLAALALLGLGLAIRAVRVRWRPVTAAVGLAVSRGLRPGARAWYVRAGDADVVLVTARRGLRLVIARPDLVSGEGMSVRRTRVLLLPAEAEDRR